MFILSINDGQYTYNSNKVIGIYDTLNTVLLQTVKILVDFLSQSHIQELYINQKHSEFRHVTIIHDFVITEWQMNSQNCIAKYKITTDLDKFLKDNCDDICKIVSEWKNEIDREQIPSSLLKYIDKISS